MVDLFFAETEVGINPLDTRGCAFVYLEEIV